jgi:glycosyltransferase involved in cell wall biosynthesis
LKILVAHEVNYETKVIYEIHEFPELLADDGHEITFLQFEEGANFRIGLGSRSKKISGRVIPGVQLELKTPHRFGVVKIDRLWTTFSSWFEIARIFKLNKYDLVLNYAVPTFGPQLLILSKIYSVPFIHRALDASHVILKTKWELPIYIVEKFMYRYADYLSTNNEAMLKYCIKMSGRTRDGHVHYPPLDLDHFLSYRKNDQKLAKSLRIAPEDKVLMYMGSLFYFSGLNEVIEEFARMNLATAGYKLLIIGDGEQRPLLQKLVSDNNLEHAVIFTGVVPYSELPRYMKLGSVAINPMEKLLVSDVAFPNKVIQYMATGIPVVSTRLDGLKTVFGDRSAITWSSSPKECVRNAVGLIEGETNLRDVVSRQVSELNIFQRNIAFPKFLDFIKTVNKKSTELL